jgi:nucleotide-binding universal stress UspA family protein
MSQQRQDLQSLLSKKTALLTLNSVNAIPTLLEGNPSKVVPELANLYAPSLISMGTHGRGSLARGMIGSLSEQMLWTTRCPSLAVGPHVPPVSSSSFPFKRILYAADSAEAAPPAAELAMSFADMCGAEIDVLSLTGRHSILHPNRLTELRSHSFRALEGLSPAQRTQLASQHADSADDKAHDRILESIRERSIDLLVVDIRETTHVGLAIRTPGAFRLIVDATCPVLTTRV